MSEEQRWSPGAADAYPPAGGTALTLQHDDGGNSAPAAESVSVRLSDTGELPFLQPRPVESAPDRIDRLSALARRPATIVVAAIIAGLVLAAIVTRTDQGGPSPSDAASSVQPALGNPDPDVDAEQSVDGVVAEDGVELKSSVVDDEVDEIGSVARSSGDAFEADGGGVLTVQVVESAEAITNPTTTIERPTTAAPTTAVPTTAEPSTTTTTTTEATTTTTEATTTTTEATTTTTENQVAEAEGVWIKALVPGTTDEGNPAVFRPGDIVLRAEGSEDIIAYRFRIYIQDDDEWERVESSGWRFRRRFNTRFSRYEGRTIRWTVEGRAIDGTRTPPAPPLYIYVESDRDFDD